MITKIIEEKVDIDKLLIVTFTNAAASEMRERILKAIDQKLDENPENSNLQKQITLLNMANICTIDSFCLEVVRNYFYELEQVSPNFRIGDAPEIELLKQEVLEDLFEKKYEIEDENFSKLLETYTSYRDDTPLKDLILKIHDSIMSLPFPEKWLQEKIEVFNRKDNLEEDFGQTSWGKILLQDMKEELEDGIKRLKKVEEELSLSIELEPFLRVIQSDINELKTWLTSLSTWDKAYQIAQNFKLITWPRKKVDSLIKEEAKIIRDRIKKKITKKANKIFVSDSKQSNQDILDMYEVLVKLENLILEFQTEFIKKKREKNMMDFSDIEHMALQILVKEENGQIVPTEVAKKYQEKFQEIAIDEYQDSNLVQEYILTSITKGNNLFMVGDVKQSIYKFRQAMPELFLSKYHTYGTVEETDKPGRKIQLYQNFRSRKEVLDFTNLIFQDIMSESLGDIEYEKEEYLNFGAEDYQNNQENPKTEICLIELEEEILEERQEEDSNSSLQKDKNDFKEMQLEEEEDSELVENIEVEAKQVAFKIQELIKNKYPIYDRKKQEFRPIQYRDIAILLRSTKDKACVYEQELTKREIPVFSDSTQEYLDSMEIQTMMSLLKIIDNPIQDIPLVTVLRSSIGGFDDNELVAIRLCDKQDCFYHCLEKARVSVSDKLREKINQFLEKVAMWRKEQEYLSLDELIWKIYQETGFYHYVGLMPNGALRQANLKMLFERARKYETASFKGLYHFIHYIDRIQIHSGDLSSAKMIGENDDVVRIMSIHKSKGLEFPVVFVVNMNKRFNQQDVRKDPILIHPELGLGAKLIDYGLQVQYDTLTREAIKRKMTLENIAEEMRVLYVALTRAKEKLFLVGSLKGVDKKFVKMKQEVLIYPKENNKIPYTILPNYDSYLDWIILVMLYESQNKEIMQNIKISKKEILQKEKQEEEKEQQEIINPFMNLTEKKNISKELKEKIEYEYPQKIDSQIPTKMAVTEIKQKKLINLGREIEEHPILFEKPKFLIQEKTTKLTGAEKGTVMHYCMQQLNPKVEYDEKKLKDFVEELERKNKLSEIEAKSISIVQLLAFTQSFLWKELQKAKECYREKSFYLSLPAKEIYKEETKETILVQGMVDLYYRNEKGEIILVDYKTDYVERGKEENLKEKYKEQLDFYKRALEEALKEKVSKVYLYSTVLGKEIEL